jgi:hypothetical protein
MAATTAQLIALGNDGAFRQRVRILALQQAAVVYAESGATTGHGIRKTLALSLIQHPELADQLASTLATRTNLVASNVSYDFNAGQIVTDATDAAILSQLATDWDLLAGV